MAKSSLLKNLLAIVLAITLCVGLLPAAAFAEEEAPLDGGMSALSDELTAEPEPAPEEDPESAPEPTVEVLLVIPAAADDETVPSPDTEPEPAAAVSVRFICAPAETDILVYDAEDNELSPEEDGSFLLLPGTYVYTAFCDGYAPAFDELTVEASAEELTVEVVLEQSSDPEIAAYAINSTFNGSDAEVDDDGNLLINDVNFHDANFMASVKNPYANIDTNHDGKLSTDEVNATAKLDLNACHIENLKGIEYFTSLIELWCPNNSFTEIDISKLTELEILWCYKNSNLTALDLQNNTKLKTLECNYTQLSKLDVSNNVALVKLKCDNSQLRELDVSNNPALQTLECYNNQLSVLILDNNTMLTSLRCSSQNIAATAAWVNNSLILDMKDIVDEANISRVSVTSGSYDPSTGIWTLPDPADEQTIKVSYTFETGAPSSLNGSMTVNVTVTVPEKPECKHNIVIDPAVDATCTQPGKTEGSHCSVCKAVIVAQKDIPANGHTEVTDPAVDATCTQPGKTEGSHCSVCNAVLVKQEDIPANGHTEVTDPAVDATCTQPGKTAGSHCSVCNTVIVEQKDIPANGHTEVTDSAVDPTCTEPGKTEGSHCSVCKTVIVAQKTIPANGHTEVTDHAVDPTCTEPGKTEGSHCSVCNTVIDEQKTIPATGHTKVTDHAVDPTCTTDGKTDGSHCSVCNTVIVEQKTIPATGHTKVTDAAVDPTCTEDGKTEGSHCSVCNTVIVEQKTIPATGHTKVTDNAVDPTCTEPGKTEGSHCSVCNAVIDEQKTIPATGHTKVTDAAVDPTCTEDGKTEGSHCSVCNTVIVEQKTIPATGHSFGEWEVTTAPTYDKEGTETRKCKNTGCTATETRSIAPISPKTKFDLSELAGSDTSVTIDVDGVIYTADETGSFGEIDVPVGSSILVSVSWYNSGSDLHSTYPVSMKVYLVSNTGNAPSAEPIPEFDDLLRYAGSSIRVTGVKGIRMITEVDSALKSALINDGAAGYTLEEYGTLLCFGNEVAGSLSLNDSYARHNYAYSRANGQDPVFKYNGSSIQYTNVLVGFSNDQCSDDIAMRPYMILRDSDGNTHTVYGGIVYRSIGYIAYQNRNAFDPSTSAYDYIWDIIHYVYGDQYDADYKK